MRRLRLRSSQIACNHALCHVFEKREDERNLSSNASAPSFWMKLKPSSGALGKTSAAVKRMAAKAGSVRVSLSGNRRVLACKVRMEYQCPECLCIAGASRKTSKAAYSSCASYAWCGGGGWVVPAGRQCSWGKKWVLVCHDCPTSLSRNIPIFIPLLRRRVS